MEIREISREPDSTVKTEPKNKKKKKSDKKQNHP